MKKIVTLTGLMLLVMLTLTGCNQDLENAYKAEQNRASQKLTALKASSARKLATKEYSEIRRFYSQADQAIAQANRVKQKRAREKEAAREQAAFEREAAERQAAAKRGRSYVVRKGDWLSKIAAREYGTMTKWRDIYNANRSIIKDPDLIYPGQKLLIPSS